MDWFNISNIFISVYGYPLSYIELIGTITGLFSVLFAARSNILTWPVGLINVVCFFIIFFQVHLYSDMFLQVYFFVTSVYGWVMWAKFQTTDTFSVIILSPKQRVYYASIIVAATLISGVLIKNIHLLLPSVFATPASYPFTDSFVAILSVVATVLLAQKKLENWVLWIVVDLISVVLYAKKNVIFISIEYAVFLILASMGLIEWIKLYRNEKRTGIR